MFTESLLEFSAGRARRGWSTAVAWTLQSLLIAFAIILPLWQTNALPRVEVFVPVGAPPGAPPPKSPNVGDTVRRPIADIVRSDVLTLPPNIPKTIDTTPEAVPAGESSAEPCSFCVPGGIPGQPSTGPGFVPGIMLQPAEATPPPPKPVMRVKVSDLSQGFLVHQVQPVYPAIARAARVEGTVVLAAVINRDGSIQNLHVVSGHPMLVLAAIDAVKQWRYRPYMLSGQPVEVETQISVIFTLAH